ncbi:MAG: hypothetical protein WCG45_05970 [bacterium]
MTEELKEIIKEEIVKTPREVGEAISNFDWEKISEEIGKKYSLNDEEINILQGEIALLLIGITKGYDFTDSVENNVLISKNIAKQIVNEIFEKILNPITNKILERVKVKNTTWKENASFILSGGNYFSLMSWPENEIGPEKITTGNNFGPSKFDDLKSKFTI